MAQSSSSAGNVNGYVQSAPATSLTTHTFSQCWTLDETGNWSGFKQSNDGATWSLEQTRSANTVNELTTINASVGEQWADPKYDANGNMSSIPRPGLNRPSWANLTTDQWSDLTADQWAEMEVAPTFRATYDAWNRLVKLTDGGSGETVQENQYDGRGYRSVTKTYTNGTLDETRHAYSTDQWQCIEERLGTSTTPDRQFIWGVRYIDDLILRDRSVSGGTLNERLYALQDANWNVTSITDSTGTVQERYEYDPYGVTTTLAPDFSVRAASNFAWETTYCSYRWDQSTGLYAVRNRFYHSQLGVWITPDPLRATRSLFQYCGSHPTKLVDPRGLIGIFFDGAGWGPNDGTNIGTLFNSYCGEAYHYQTRFWPNNIWANIRRAKERVCAAVCRSRSCGCDSTTSNQNEPVHLFGWSRGAVAAMTLASLLESEGCTCSQGDCPSFSSVRVDFLGLIDPVDTGGYQMFGTEDNDISSNVDNAWVGQAQNHTWLGSVIFQSEDTTHTFDTNMTNESFGLTHEQSGWNSGVKQSLKNSAQSAGASFQCPGTSVPTGDGNRPTPPATCPRPNSSGPEVIPMGVNPSTLPPPRRSRVFE